MKNYIFLISVHNNNVLYKVQNRGIEMRYKIDHCYYELVKDLLSSLDSLVKNVEKDEQGAIVTLQDGNTRDDLMKALNRGPLYTFTQESHVIIL